MVLITNVVIFRSILVVGSPSPLSKALEVSFSFGISLFFCWFVSGCFMLEMLLMAFVQEHMPAHGSGRCIL